jgi:hypothetical protein
MRKTLAVIVLTLALTAGMAAQTCSGRACSGNITATNASCITTACVALNLPTNSGAATLTLTGTFSATLAFEGAGDGKTFVALNCYPSNSVTAATSATAVGTFQCNVAGYAEIRVRCSAFTSGTAVVAINSSPASAPR